LGGIILNKCGETRRTAFSNLGGNAYFVGDRFFLSEASHGFPPWVCFEPLLPAVVESANYGIVAGSGTALHIAIE
jgi:hypothetical protein